MIIGGDVVQKALAQTAGEWFTPTCFSFGWVTCSFSMLVGVLGDGRLLPPPDVSAKVFNLESGYGRENRSWVVGRLLRDLERSIDEQHTEVGRLKIRVFEAMPVERRKRFVPRDAVEVLWLLTTFFQLGVAAVPLGLYRDWSPLLITGSGIIAVLGTGILHQWNVEKLPVRRRTDKTVALTSGNGASKIIIIRGCSEGLDLEDLAAAPDPCESRSWSSPKFVATNALNEQPSFNKDSFEAKSGERTWKGLPVGAWWTRAAIAALSVFWIVLLTTVAGIRAHTWYLVAVGGIGMVQNAFASAVRRDPRTWGMNLLPVLTLSGTKVMDVLMDFEVSNPGYGLPLLLEFFPGHLRPSEEEWWQGQRSAYDKQREDEGRNVSQMQRIKYLYGRNAMNYEPERPSALVEERDPLPSALRTSHGEQKTKDVRFAPTITDDSFNDGEKLEKRHPE